MAEFGVLRDAVLTIEGTSYVGQCASVKFTPDVNIQTYRVLDPDSILQDVDSPVWTVEIKGVQDWSTGGLAKLLHQNHGLELDMVFSPKSGTGNAKFTATVLGMSSAFGGDQGEYAETEVTLPVIGQPVLGTNA